MASTIFCSRGAGRYLGSLKLSYMTVSEFRMVSRPIRSPVSRGPILWPKQPLNIRSTSSAVATWSCTQKTASLMVSIRTLLVTNPGASCTTMPSLPAASRSPMATASVSSDVK
ncbi:hypothetical protein SF12_07645 [Streptomyces sp. MBRL 601]|nr:hypothetical protein SF12_07645 [Streptomyces sp. MBRL 601]